MILKCLETIYKDWTPTQGTKGHTWREADDSWDDKRWAYRVPPTLFWTWTHTVTCHGSHLYLFHWSPFLPKQTGPNPCTLKARRLQFPYVRFAWYNDSSETLNIRAQSSTWGSHHTFTLESLLEKAWDPEFKALDLSRKPGTTVYRGHWEWPFFLSPSAHLFPRKRGS